jgi:hypothetical protein
MEDKFYENPLVRQDGYALSNKEAGLDPDKRERSLNISTKYVDYSIRKTNLRDQIMTVREGVTLLTGNYSDLNGPEVFASKKRVPAKLYYQSKMKEEDL